jgi:hypothetical protein
MDSFGWHGGDSKNTSKRTAVVKGSLATYLEAIGETSSAHQKNHRWSVWK